MATVVRRSVRLPVGGRRPLRSQEAKANPRAFAELYQRHHQALHRYCRSILHHEEDARDALQSALTRALAALATEEREFDVKPWLFRIAHNEAVSMLRRRREVHELAPVIAGSAPGPERRIAEREELAQLRADLDDLPERQRAALVLRELSGLSHAEIGSALDINERTVKQAIFEARQALLACRDGRELECSTVQRTLSDGDGRALRGRRMRAHLRSCAACGAFRAQLDQRPRELAALAPPLPAAAGAALLAQVLAGGGATGGAVAGAGAGAGALATKLATGALVVATAGGGYVATHEIVADPPKPRTARASDAAPRQAGARPQVAAVRAPAPPQAGGGSPSPVAAAAGASTTFGDPRSRHGSGRAGAPEADRPGRSDTDESPGRRDDRPNDHAPGWRGDRPGRSEDDNARGRRGDRPGRSDANDRRGGGPGRRGDGPGRHGDGHPRGRREDRSSRSESDGPPSRSDRQGADGGSPPAGAGPTKPNGGRAKERGADRPPAPGHSPSSSKDRAPSSEAEGSPAPRGRGPDRSGDPSPGDRPGRTDPGRSSPGGKPGDDGPSRPGAGREPQPGAERPSQPGGGRRPPRGGDRPAKPGGDQPSQPGGNGPNAGEGKPPKAGGR